MISSLNNCFKWDFCFNLVNRKGNNLEMAWWIYVPVTNDQYNLCVVVLFLKIIYDTEIHVVDVLKFWTLVSYQNGLDKQFILKKQPDQASLAHVF